MNENQIEDNLWTIDNPQIKVNIIKDEPQEPKKYTYGKKITMTRGEYPTGMYFQPSSLYFQPSPSGFQPSYQPQHGGMNMSRLDNQYITIPTSLSSAEQIMGRAIRVESHWPELDSDDLPPLEEARLAAISGRQLATAAEVSLMFELD